MGPFNLKTHVWKFPWIVYSKNFFFYKGPDKYFRFCWPCILSKLLNFALLIQKQHGQYINIRMWSYFHTIFKTGWVDLTCGHSLWAPGSDSFPLHLLFFGTSYYLDVKTPGPFLNFLGFSLLIFLFYFPGYFINFLSLKFFSSAIQFLIPKNFLFSEYSLLGYPALSNRCSLFPFNSKDINDRLFYFLKVSCSLQSFNFL